MSCSTVIELQISSVHTCHAMCHRVGKGLSALQRANSPKGITTNTTSDFSSTCVMLALVAGRQDCQPRPNSQLQPLRLFLSSFRLQHFYMTVNIASEMHSNAFQCIAQPNTTFA